MRPAVWGWARVALADDDELGSLLTRLDDAAALALGAAGDPDPRYHGAVALLRERACAAGADLCPPPPGEPLTATGGLAVSVLPGTAVSVPEGWTWRHGDGLGDHERWIPGLTALEPAGDGLVAAVVDHLILVGPAGLEASPWLVPEGHSSCLDLVSGRAALHLTAPSCFDGSPWTASVTDPVEGDSRTFPVGTAQGAAVRGRWLAVQGEGAVAVRRLPSGRLARTVDGELVSLGADGSVAARRGDQVWVSRPDGGEQPVAVSPGQSLFLLADGGWVVVRMLGLRHDGARWAATRFRAEVVRADGVGVGVVDWERAGRSAVPSALSEHPDGGSFALTRWGGGDLVISRPGRTAAVVPLPGWLDRPFPALGALGPPGEGEPTLTPITLPDGADPRSVELLLGRQLGPRTWELPDPDSWPVVASSHVLSWDHPAPQDLRMWVWPGPGAAAEVAPIARRRVVDEAGRPLPGVAIQWPDNRGTCRTDLDGTVRYWPSTPTALPQPLGTDGRWLDHEWRGGELVVSGAPATPRAADGTEWGGAWDRREDGVLHTVWLPPDARTPRPGFGRTERDVWFGDEDVLVWADGRRYTRRAGPLPGPRVVLGEQRRAPGEVASLTGTVGGRPIRAELVVRAEDDLAAPADPTWQRVWVDGLSAEVWCDDCGDPGSVLRWAAFVDGLRGVPLQPGARLHPLGRAPLDRTVRWDGEERCGERSCVWLLIEEYGSTSRLLVERDTLRPRSWVATGPSSLEVVFEWAGG